MYGMNDVTLSVVRELGFNTCLGIGRAPAETVFFFGPDQVGGRREDGAHATEEAILEFISHYDHQIQVAKDYLANGQNNKTYEWTKTSRDCKPSVETMSIVQEILRDHGSVNLQVGQLEYGARIIDDLVSLKVTSAALEQLPGNGR